VERTGERFLIAVVVTTTIGVAFGTGLWAESKPSVASVTGTTGSGGNPATGKLALLEVQSGQQTWQGLNFGRMANLLVLLTRDGQLRRIELDRDSEVRELNRPFEPTGQRDLESALRKEFGPKFKTLRTPHYLICHNTNEAFARETADLVEQLYRAFTNFWGARGMKLDRPQFPMIVLIFDSEAEFRDYATSTPGASTLSHVAGIYSIETNRVAMFNAAGKETKKFGDTRWHNQSTLIHEATHQIAFNSGCHRRLADAPTWFVEGLAMYFEAPEIQGNKVTWQEVGSMNPPRLDRFASFRKKGRKPDSLKTLVSGDQRFRDDSSANDAYAESWALTYFLVNQRTPQFLRYVRAMSAKPALQQDTTQQRLEDFQDAFGRDLRQLDISLLRYFDDLAKK
jgi:hypothetical protein